MDMLLQNHSAKALAIIICLCVYAQVDPGTYVS